ncbi:hypothetical protein M0R45_019650 [Rubus argutus]|uniref:Uncharacterized protein n=1 Tax=Rubus argutus TaxID=59490 RepID=A0AAW1X8G4_RUBAR
MLRRSQPRSNSKLKTKKNSNKLVNVPPPLAQLPQPPLSSTTSTVPNILTPKKRTASDSLQSPALGALSHPPPPILRRKPSLRSDPQGAGSAGRRR